MSEAKADLLRNMLNSLHDVGVRLDTLTVKVRTVDSVYEDTITGQVFVSISEDGSSGELVLEVP